MKRMLVVDDDSGGLMVAPIPIGNGLLTVGNELSDRTSRRLTIIMTTQVGVRPRIVAVSSESAFLHLVQTLLDSLGLAVRTTSDWESATSLVERVRPKLIILDLVPGREELCWLALETIKVRPTTRAIPVLVCPVAGWLLAGREQLLGLHGVYVWPEGFELEDLLGTVQLALAA